MRTLIICLLAAAGCSAIEGCKCVPGSECWPSSLDWSALNETVSGKLLKPAPLGAVCYQSEPVYDAEACRNAVDTYTQWPIHSADPLSCGAATAVDESCLPLYPNGTSVNGDPDAGRKGCSRSDQPVYVVNATQDHHVQGAIKFARDFNLALNIKNTGHSGIRASIAGSLSIWTHHMKDLEVIRSFQPACGDGSTNMSASNTPQTAVRFGAGIQGGEAVELLGKYNLTAVSGTNSDVGLAGWASAGGHGYLTGSFGQGSDNILEATIVTAGGQVVVANECQNQDLYWAVRGGGGNTFGVMTSLTMKAYPLPVVRISLFDIAVVDNTTSTQWWDFVAQFQAHLVDMQDRGMHGYWSLGTEPFAITGSLFGYNRDEASVSEALKPLKTFFKNQGATASANFSSLPVTDYAQFAKLSKKLNPGSVLGRTARVSRLISRRTAVEDTSAFARVLETVGTSSLDFLPKGSISMSGTTTLSSQPVDDASLPAAWRDATVHLIVGQSYDDNTTPSQREQIENDMAYNKLSVLRSLDTSAPAYSNEASSKEPGWQWVFFSSNYPRLREIKEKYDPDGLFWCPQCVGSEAWVRSATGSICRSG